MNQSSFSSMTEELAALYHWERISCPLIGHYLASLTVIGQYQFPFRVSIYEQMGMVEQTAIYRCSDLQIVLLT